MILLNGLLCLKLYSHFNLEKILSIGLKHYIENPSSIVKNNGYLSKPILINRGIRQGCAISAMIFILVIEILALKLKQNNSIKGIHITKINGGVHEQLLSQYADDITIFIKNETVIKTDYSYSK